MIGRLCRLLFTKHNGDVLQLLPRPMPVAEA